LAGWQEIVLGKLAEFRIKTGLGLARTEGRQVAGVKLAIFVIGTYEPDRGDKVAT
jgi:hypothetical protein